MEFLLIEETELMKGRQVRKEWTLKNTHFIEILWFGCHVPKSSERQDLEPIELNEKKILRSKVLFPPGTRVTFKLRKFKGEGFVNNKGNIILDSNEVKKLCEDRPCSRIFESDAEQEKTFCEENNCTREYENRKSSLNLLCYSCCGCRLTTYFKLGKNRCSSDAICQPCNSGLIFPGQYAGLPDIGELPIPHSRPFNSALYRDYTGSYWSPDELTWAYGSQTIDRVPTMLNPDSCDPCAYDGSGGGVPGNPQCTCDKSVYSNCEQEAGECLPICYS